MANNKKAIEFRNILSRSFCMEDQWKPLIRELDDVPSESQDKLEEREISNQTTIDFLGPLQYMITDGLHNKKIVRKPPAEFVRCEEPVFINYQKQDFLEESRQQEIKVFFQKFGQIVKMMKEAVCLMDDTYQMLNVPNCYTGLCISNDSHGLYISNNRIKAILVNPLSSQAKSLDGVRRSIIDTTIHELAHRKENSHGEHHNSEMTRVRDFLADQGVLSEVDRRLQKLLEKHENLYWSLNRKYKA